MPPDPDPISFAAVITTNIARLAAERGLTVE